MTGFSTAIQGAIYDQLSNNAPLVAAVVGIYDRVPQGNQDSDFPYVVIGEDVGATFDTDTELMQTVAITIHTWSRYNGRIECKNIQGLIYDALHRKESELSFSGFDFVGVNQESEQTFLDNDGHTTHGTQTYNLIIERL